ncbi:hypothetical protein [Kitasatospora sp. McL0602]|uniref:hypothetical protein n=1 Tax=Kitasatospora sp. McL0602 TaxID=3439530 RepID=UPI003F8CB2D7
MTGQSAEIPGLVERSIGQLAERAAQLVDAFDLPGEFFAARPIAGPDYQSAFAAPGSTRQSASRAAP